MLPNCRVLILKTYPIKNTARLCHKVNKQNDLKQPKVAQDVMNYLESSIEYKDIIDVMPKTLLKKYKTPETMYLINKKTAKDITSTILNYLNKEAPIVEVNPGFGFLTQELLRCQKNPIFLYETSNHFIQFLNVSLIMYIK